MFPEIRQRVSQASFASDESRERLEPVMISFLVVLWRFACRCFYFCVTGHASPSPITHVPNLNALTALMNSPQPTVRTERAVSRPASTFLQTPNDSVDSEGASSSENASSLVSAAPMLNIDVGKLHKAEMQDFCKLLDVSNQGSKEILETRILGEIKRRHDEQGTNPLEAPVFQQAASRYASERARKSMGKKRSAQRKSLMSSFKFSTSNSY